MPPRRDDNVKNMFGILAVVLLLFFVFMVLLLLRDQYVWITDVHFVIIGFVFFVCMLFAFFSLTMSNK